MDQSAPRDAAPDGPEGPELAGALLRRGRLARGLDITECAARLRARPGQIEALERGDLRGFGGDVYARGFLRSYAALVGVDPREVLRLHGGDPAFRGPVLPPRETLRIRRDPPGWLVGVLGVTVVAGVVAAILGLGGSRAPESVAPSDPDAGSGAVSSPAPRPDPQPAPTPEPAAPSTPAGPPVDVVLTFEAASWLEVLVDGVPVEPGTLVPAGETLRFGGQELVTLRLGNAGGVRVELGGRDLGPPGRSDQVVRVAYGPEGVVTPEGAEAGSQR